MLDNDDAMSIVKMDLANLLLRVDEEHKQVRKHAYRILPSKHPSPCKRPPPFFDDPIVHVHMRCTYKWLLHVNAHPRFLVREFQAPMGA